MTRKHIFVGAIIWDMFILSMFSYLIFFKDASGWWYVFMVAMSPGRDTWLKWEDK